MEAVTLIIKNPSNEHPDYTVELPLTTTVGELKEALAQGYPGNPKPCEQKLIFAGRLLESELQLSAVMKDRELAFPQTVHLSLPQQPRDRPGRRSGDSRSSSPALTPQPSPATQPVPPTQTPPAVPSQTPTTTSPVLTGTSPPSTFFRPENMFAAMNGGHLHPTIYSALQAQSPTKSTTVAAQSPSHSVKNKPNPLYEQYLMIYWEQYHQWTVDYKKWWDRNAAKISAATPTVNREIESQDLRGRGVVGYTVPQRIGEDDGQVAAVAPNDEGGDQNAQNAPQEPEIQEIGLDDDQGQSQLLLALKLALLVLIISQENHSVERIAALTISAFVFFLFQTGRLEFVTRQWERIFPSRETQAAQRRASEDAIRSARAAAAEARGEGGDGVSEANADGDTAAEPAANEGVPSAATEDQEDGSAQQNTDEAAAVAGQGSDVVAEDNSGVPPENPPQEPLTTLDEAKLFCHQFFASLVPSWQPPNHIIEIPQVDPNAPIQNAGLGG